MFFEINIHFILKHSLIKQYVKFQQPKNNSQVVILIRNLNDSPVFQIMMMMRTIS